MIAKHLKCMQHLNICGTSIGDQGFVSVCNLPSLHKLQVNCHLLTSTGFLDGAESLGNLKSLEIGSNKISIGTIQDSLKYLKNLVYIKIKSIPVTTICVMSMVEQCPCLSILSIHCKHSPLLPWEQTMQLCQQFGVKAHLYLSL